MKFCCHFVATAGTHGEKALVLLDFFWNAITPTRCRDSWLNEFCLGIICSCSSENFDSPYYRSCTMDAYQNLISGDKHWDACKTVVSRGLCFLLYWSIDWKSSTRSHIGCVNNLLHRDLIVMLLRKQLCKCGENRISCFLLPSVHIFLPNNSQNLFRTECSVKSASCFLTSFSIQ